MSEEVMVAIEAARTISRTVAAEGAAQVDRDSAHPVAAMAAIARSGLLYGALSTESGGPGLDTTTLAEISRVLAHGCGSTAMIWAMHQIQVACLDRHRGDGELLAKLLDDLRSRDGLIASVTSEKGVGGDIRTSRTHCAAERGAVAIVKEAPTVSYCAVAGAFLITARRSEDSVPSDQVLVLATREQSVLEDVGAWDMLGMRGTGSPGARIRVVVDPDQVLPTAFAEIAESTMAPLSHILWSAAWIGIAESALDRATRYLRLAARGRSDGPIGDIRLARAETRLAMLHALLRSVIAGYDGLAVPTSAFQLEVNNLKLAASTETVRIAQTALEVCGMAGYAEQGAYSISPMLRNLLSASLMISNSRLLTTNAETMLMRRYD